MNIAFDYKKIIVNLNILFLLLKKELKLRYYGSVIGFIWSILNPLCFAAVYFVAFKVIMRFDQDNYAISLIIALFPWMWIVNSLVQGTNSVRNNFSLVKKIRFNYTMLPLSNILHDIIHFIFCIPIVIGFIIYVDGDLFISWFWQLPIMIIIQLALLFPIILFLSSLNVFIKDIEYMVSLAVSILFFLTPIIYPISIVPAKFLIFYKFNLFAVLIDNWRSMFLKGELDYIWLLAVFLISVVLTFFSYKYFTNKSKFFGEVL